MRSLVLLLSVLVLAASPAWADPVQVFTVQDPIQDDWIVEGEVEELSTNPHNPAMEWITSATVPWTGHIPCPSEFMNTVPNVQVSITNMTQRYFSELYYVGDAHDVGAETTFTNFDELIVDANGPFGNPGLAFKIDAVGQNTPLVFESMAPDQIFEPGETWEFVIQEYANMFGLPSSALGSVGPFPLGAVADASWFGADPNGLSSGSIITPEPVTLGLLALGGLAMIRRRRRA